MCVIAVARHGEYPDNSTIQSMWEKNPHGAGLAYYHPDMDKVHFRKGLMELSDVLEVVDQIETQFMDKENLPLLAMHFRLATVGGQTEALTHPFPIDLDKMDDSPLEGEADRVLFHNGHWSGWDDACIQIANDIGLSGELPDGGWSDSRAMAWLAAQFEEPDTEREHMMFREDIGTGKIMTLNAQSATADQPCVRYFGRWLETNDLDMKVSNKSYMSYSKVSYSYNWKDDDEDEDTGTSTHTGRGGPGYASSYGSYAHGRGGTRAGNPGTSLREQDDTSQASTRVIHPNDYDRMPRVENWDPRAASRPSQVFSEEYDVVLDYVQGSDIYWGDDPFCWMDPDTGEFEVLEDHEQPPVTAL